MAHKQRNNEGWVEGLVQLKDSDSATGLLKDDVADSKRGLALKTNQMKANAAAGSNGAGSAPSLPVVPGVMTSAEDHESCMEHALAVMAKELEDVGEVLVEVGAQCGWGPVGLSKDQLAATIERLKAAAAEKGACASVLRERSIELPCQGGGVLVAAVADVAVRQCTAPDRSPIEVRVAVIGNVDSGKSTMVGVLTRSMLDDGRGLARSKMFKHHHEEATGRTSSIGQHTLCLDAKGTILNDVQFKNATCGDYIARASKVVTLVDLAGHERYFRTTAYGLTGHLPDYACLIVGANMGVVGMCKEHLGVALALKVPVFFVITKVDICPEHILKTTVQALTAILRKPGVKKKPFLVRSMDDVLLCARNMHTDSLAPVFLSSSVTGKGLDLVRTFFSLLPQRQRWVERQSGLAEFVIDETFGVPGVGTVVAGTVKQGIIRPNATLLLGPDIADGLFKATTIKSIHYKRLPVGQVVAGQTAAMALKKVKRTQVRKGMVLVDERVKPVASWEFDADIAILTHSTTIQPRYQAVIHCEIIRQAAQVVAMDHDLLRSGDRACVRFRFLQRPEYISPNTRFVFREGRTKGIGMVIGTEHQPLKVPVYTAQSASDASPAPV
mmetsp:Transcript_28049/g.75778  ORF Transcript_28049/g.75778 Transcript_28049/m.75778 type:complete len:612 (-) Transcript_28049:155-1990(-)|eukprot:CAMPEP_0202338062 /NCGR_PEP_ID=MMETSP1126-20121109/490_1 /ASSEMBLY_ACC=CAM_ASM_000457 /TAXON_ID=3047 /ORGANISM="Dunaliella tertiolecta, Strain CCMP1320" /LENGTH=611 /DNA_ID=CAMNT_0048928369 /DNA_START=311 /DNA_END=2146 /DNA_ORIENTATION=+